jgi:hypothetical protein
MSWNERLFHRSQKAAAEAFSVGKADLEGIEDEALPLPLTAFPQHAGGSVVRRVFGIHGSHHERLAGYCTYGFADLPTLVMFKLRKRLLLNDRPFTDEAEWRRIYAAFHEPLPSRTPYASDDPRLLEWLCTESYGALLLRRDGDGFVLDTSELAPYVRRTDDTLDTQVRFRLERDELKMTELWHEGRAILDFGSAEGRRALMASTAGLFTVATLKVHLQYCHFEVADRYTTFAIQHIPHSHPLRRMLAFAEYGALRGTDQAGITLLDYTFPAITNLDRQGLRDYLDLAQRHFSLFSWFHLPKLLAERGLVTGNTEEQRVRKVFPILDVALEWWEVLETYVRGYVEAYYPSASDIDARTKRWLLRLFDAYGVRPEGPDLRQAIIDFGTSIAFAPVIHQLVFNHRSVDVNPFRFSTRLRHAEPGPGEIEYQREALLRASVTAATTLPSILFTSPLDPVALDDRGRQWMKLLRRRVQDLEALLAERHPDHTILLPSQVTCSVRW